MKLSDHPANRAQKCSRERFWTAAAVAAVGRRWVMGGVGSRAAVRRCGGGAAGQGRGGVRVAAVVAAGAAEVATTSWI
ncbi:hypothetical protein ABZS77_15055 [Micromonospora sp. NPDC005298]|uniref:hypothetical protein n=1 Tax=Micromonospora sp. NPDC005298 TaxID=3156873 RepID=UPI0033BB2F19